MAGGGNGVLVAEMDILDRDLKVINNRRDHALGEALIPTLFFLTHSF